MSEGAPLEKDFYEHSAKAFIAISLGDLEGFLGAHKLAIKDLEEIAMDISSSPWKETSISKRIEIFGPDSLYLRPRLVKGLINRYSTHSENYLRLVRGTLGKRRFDLRENEEWILGFNRKCIESFEANDFGRAAKEVYHDAACIHSMNGDVEKTIFMCNQIVYDAIHQMKELSKKRREADSSRQDYDEFLKDMDYARRKLNELIESYNPGGEKRESLLEHAREVSNKKNNY